MLIDLQIEINYNLDEMKHAGISEDTARDELHEVLLASVNRLVGEGGLSGATLATVNFYDVTISDGENSETTYHDSPPAERGNRRSAVPRFRTRKNRGTL
jgi:hypothetical protein